MTNQHQPAAPPHCGAAVVSEARALEWAIRLGAKSWVSARPNPPVGCVVLTRSGKCVGYGRHTSPGEPHAEVVALQMAGSQSKDSTVVVTLEPCNHHGRTPPCTERILKSGVRRVVYATKDPNPAAEGGSDFLKHHGIDVEHVPHRLADRLNAPHVTWSMKSRPHVIAKWAQSPEGNMCPPPTHGQWISSVRSRMEVHRIRGRVDAVLTGMGSVIADDCLLSPRNHKRRQTPLIAVASRSRSLPPTARVLENPSVELITEGNPLDQLKALQRLGAHVVLLEAGPRLLHAYWKANLIDEAWIFVGPKPMPDGTGRSPVPSPEKRLRGHPKGFTMDLGPDRLYQIPIESKG